MRLLSIIQWHHFAFLVISLALLGYGASGTFLTLLQRPLLRRFPAAFPLLAVSFGVSAVGSFVVAQRLRLNPLEVMWDPFQFASFASLYLLLAVPFFCAGAAIGLALMRFEGSIHAIYRSDLVGAACGAVTAIVALYLLTPETCLRLVGLAGWLAAAVALTGRGGAPGFRSDRLEGGHTDGGVSDSVDTSRRGWQRAVIAMLLLAGIGVSFAWPGSWLAPRMSEYKAQRKALTVPGVEVLAERSSPLGAIAVLRSPRVPFRVAPGLSFAFTGTVPEQVLVFSDGEIAAIVDQKPVDGRSLAYLDHLPAVLAFELLERPRAALVGTGGGSAVTLALRQQASEVHLIEADPRVLEVVAEDLEELSGDLYGNPRVKLHGVASRSFFAGDRKPFDLIWLQLPAGASPAARALRESYTETVEALALLLKRIGDGGLLAIGGDIDAPPRASLRLLATLSKALEQERLEPEASIAVIRSWSSFMVLVDPDGWTDAELDVVRSFCAERSFDLAYYPGMSESEANRFNLLPEPALFRGATALLGPDRDRFIESYKFAIDPTTDDRPYFFHFLRWRTLGELMALRARGGAALMEWGYVLLVAAAVQAALAGLVLILLPLWVMRRRLRSPGAGRVGTYFLYLGLAFLLLEIAFIQRLTLFLADPLRAAATVLAGFLFFAGLGSGASRRFELRWGPRALPAVLVGVAALALLYLLFLPPLFRAGLGLSIWIKTPAVLLVIAPLAFLMGMPFPLGLRRVARTHHRLVPWAWGVNGWASVLAAVLAALLAVHVGFTAVIATGCVLYLLATLVQPAQSGADCVRKIE
jgi:hypothetical protein